MKDSLKFQQEMSAHNKSSPLALPPPASTFDRYGFGVWSEEIWEEARSLSELFEDPYKSRLLELCTCRRRSAAWSFVLAYENAYARVTNVTVVPSLLPSGTLWTSVIRAPAAESTSPAATLDLPHPSSFGYKDGIWDNEDWKRAREVAERFPDFAVRDELVAICKNRGAGSVRAFRGLCE
ncbi:Hypothetical protein, putative [Bodo saltans]|uniref:Uncharacterized protein n=1 Tax=Bodo saltans TaxID=75058 RepID=A0A0S4IRT7_BODSA|nr:Hypothetical protein, putative [Bodo saltans]|eukprot:CUE75618.1 Hypothetical protein, putative [Bodo saltans]